MRSAIVLVSALMLVTGGASAQTAAVSGAVAGVAAGKAVSTCLRHPILCGAAAAVGVVVLKSAARDPNSLTTARQQEAAGQPLTPPGYCPDETFSWLNAAVDRLCKDGIIEKCVPSDSKLRLTAKAIAFSTCAKARAKREDSVEVRRPLRADDLGLKPENLTQLRGEVSLKGRTLIVRIDMIQGVPAGDGFTMLKGILLLTDFAHVADEIANGEAYGNMSRCGGDFRAALAACVLNA